MRAKTVNEDMRFQRGVDPKTSIGIGLFDIFVKRLENAYPMRIRFYNYAGMPGGQFTVLKDELPGPWEKELLKIFGEDYIERVGDGWPQDWWFIEIKHQYVDTYKKAWEKVYNNK
jgi:hypothetical protein